MSLEDIGLGLPRQLICRGNPVMVETIVWASASDSGLAIEAGRKFPRTDFFRHIAVGTPEPTVGIMDLGWVRLQGLPQERTLITLSYYEKNKSKSFDDFCCSFIRELGRLGFVDLPEAPRDPLGFRPSGRS